MKFHTVIPYKLKRLIPMAMIAGMPVFAASCDKEPPHHDTTYVWGLDNWDANVFGPRVAASADSADVRYVYLLNDGRSLGGAPTSTILELMNRIIDFTPPENQHKIRGAGTLNNTSMERNNQQYIQDSIALVKLGFDFGKVLYGNPR